MLTPRERRTRHHAPSGLSERAGRTRRCLLPAEDTKNRRAPPRHGRDQGAGRMESVLDLADLRAENGSTFFQVVARAHKAGKRPGRSPLKPGYATDFGGRGQRSNPTGVG